MTENTTTLARIYSAAGERDAAPFQNFADYMAGVITHPQTPRGLKSALQAIVIDTLSNNSGYRWWEDEAALKFLLPRLLAQMNPAYAAGVVHATKEFIYDCLPEAIDREITEGGA